MPRIWLGVALVLGVGTSAFARVPRYSRPEIQVPVVLSDRLKPIVPRPPDIAQPSLIADDVLSIPGLLKPPRKEQEQILVQLIQNTSDTEVEEKSDYHFRLAELYATEQRYWRNIAIERRAAGDATAAHAAENKAKDYLLKTVRSMKALTENQAFRNYARMDIALFYYAYTLQSGKYMKEARTVFDNLLKNYPNSKYVPEAHLSFGDYYFEVGQLADAEARYRMVLKFPKSSVYAYAQYKLAWIHLRLQRFQEALEGFFAVSTSTKGVQTLERLGHAAKRDFARAYAEIGKAEKAYVAFQRVDRTDRAAAFEMLEYLAQLYVDQGKTDKAVYLYREMMTQLPKDPRVCMWQYRIAHGMLSAPGASNTDKVKAIEDLVSLHLALAARNQLGTRDAQECKANAFAMSGELARAYHSESNKTRNHETVGYAVRLYQANVFAFPNEQASNDNRYYFAEALWSSAVAARNDRQQTELFEHAAVVFGDVARADRARAGAASLAAVLAWMNSFGGPLGTAAVPELTRGRPAPARPLSSRHQQLVDSIAVYANTVNDPRNAELGELRFIEARLYRAADQHDKAAPLFVALVATHPTGSFAEAAAALAIDSLVILQRLDEMLALADKLAANTAFLADKPELAKIVQHVRSRSMRR